MSRYFTNFSCVKAEMDSCAAACGRDPAEILLLAVSKTMSESAIRELYDSGVRAFGENRIPELERKAAALPEDIQWHFIGPLQSNKIRKAVKLASLIHSIESISAIEKLDRIAGEEGKNISFLLEVNVSGEESKGGLSPQEFMSAARAAAACRHAVFAGLMTMAPLGAPETLLRSVFSGLEKLRNQAQEELHIDLPILSMGMSGDYKTAIECGSTIIRIGTAIFSTE